MNNIKDLRWIWLLVMAATVGFIWQQSTLAPVASAETSDAVRDVIVPAVGGPTSVLGSFVDRFIRKIAHFFEFAVLGLESEAYWTGRHTRLTVLLQLVAGLLVAACDEVLQLFTDRGAAFTDVLLDFSGFVFAALAARSILLLCRRFIKKRKADATGRRG